VPVVHFFESAPSADYYVHAPGLSLAGMAIILINHFYDQTGYLTIMQAHSTLVVKGLDPKQKVAVGPGRALSFPADTTGGESGGEQRDAFFIQPNAAIADCIEFLEWAIKRIERAAAIPEVMHEDNEASGKARVEAKQPLLEYRKRRFELFRRPETDLLRATMWQLKRARVPEFVDVNPLDWDVVATYGADEVPIDIQDRIALEKHDLDNNLRTRGAIIRERHPDKYMTDEEAAESVPTEGKLADSYRMTNALNAGVPVDAESMDNALGSPMPVGTPSVIVPPAEAEAEAEAAETKPLPVMPTAKSGGVTSQGKKPLDNGDEE